MKNNPTLLLVEDEFDQISTLQTIFEGEGFNVIYTPSAENALNYIKNNTLDIIISDVKLPGMDGFTFYKLLRNDIKKREIPFIFATGYNNPEIIDKLSNSNVTAYFTKPYEISDLLDAVRKFTDI